MMSDATILSDFLKAEIKPFAPKFYVYALSSSQRLEFVCDFIFRQCLGAEVEIVTDRTSFENKQGNKINYSAEGLTGVFRINPSGLLTEKGIAAHKPKPWFENGQLYFYKTELKNPTPALPFDIFSAVFYFVSRYEEWQEYVADKHGRFGIEHSLLYKTKQHLVPVVDNWIQEFKEKVLEEMLGAKFPVQQAKILSTLDIDNLFAFKGKGFFRVCGAIIKDIFKGDFIHLRTRWKVLMGNEKDPFDIYDEVSCFCEEHQLPLIYFFLYRNKTKYDRTVEPGNKAFISVFERLKKYTVHIGLHPSYASNNAEQLLSEEFNKLTSHLKKGIQYSRQHFLIFDIRKTPRLLMRNGVVADFSMGYSNSPGFRAGTSRPFRYYDFDKEAVQSLFLVPFCFMDGAYSIHQKMSTEEAMKTLLEMGEQVRRTGGNFVTVFHERSFYDHLYPGFSRLYKNLHLQLKEAFQNKN